MIKITVTGINEGKFARDILKALRVAVSKRARKALPIIKRELQLLVRGAIENSIEYQSILNGQLRAELGVKNSQDALDRLVNSIVNGFYVDITPVQIKNNEIIGGFFIGILTTDLQEVLNKDFSSYTTEKGVIIKWLEWLLIRGDEVIVANYEFSTNPESTQKSRTTEGIMKKSKRSWRVPPQYSGTQSNNFLTRSLDELDTVIERIVTDEWL